MVNSLNVNYFTGEKLKELQGFNRYFNAEQIDVINVKRLPDLSLGTGLYRIKIRYKPNKSDVWKEGSVFVKRSEGTAQDYEGRETRDKVDYEGEVLRWLQEFECPVPKLIDYEGDGEGILFEEDLGERSLERILIENGNKPAFVESLLKDTFKTLAQFHLKLEIAQGRIYHDLKKQKDYLDKWARYIFFVSGQRLESSEKKDLGNYMSEIIQFLENESNHVIHSDLHPGHIYLIGKDDKRKVKFDDLSGISMGPVQFDTADALEHPLVNLKDKKSIIEEYIKSAHRGIRYGLVRHRAKIYDPVSFLMAHNISAFNRSMRAAEKLVIEKTDERYKERSNIRLSMNSHYKEYLQWYLSDVGSKLNEIIYNHKDYGFSKSNLIKLKDFLLHKIPEIEEYKEPIKVKAKDAINRRGLITAAISALFCGNAKLK